MRRGILLCIVLFLLIPFVTAEKNFRLETKIVKDRILKDEVAQYNLTFVNEKTIIDNFDISSRDIINWDIFTVPRSDYRVEVFPQSSRTVQLFIKPLGHITAGVYEIRVDVTSLRTNTRLQKTFLPVSHGRRSLLGFEATSGQALSQILGRRLLLLTYFFKFRRA